MGSTNRQRPVASRRRAHLSRRLLRLLSWSRRTLRRRLPHERAPPTLSLLSCRTWCSPSAKKNTASPAHTLGHQTAGPRPVHPRAQSCQSTIPRTGPARRAVHHAGWAFTLQAPGRRAGGPLDLADRPRSETKTRRSRGRGGAICEGTGGAAENEKRVSPQWGGGESDR